ncbi:MAG TPA: sigma-54 dependent transcriptional regulator [Terrimicrobiaceae bacterium]|nr:sigma-54 dependent transcriptional regulator [Terrimicrobiaceae bacterium]
MRVLVVDDEKNIRRTFSLAVESMDHQVSTAASGKEAIEQLKRANFDVAFLDLKLSQESGLDILEEIVRASPQTFVVIITAYASVETAVEAMRRRAFDYVPKPCTPEQIRHVLTSVERTRKLERQVADLESRLVASGPELDLATESPAMRRVIDLALKAAQSEATVLLLGETGTGKSVLAREIHRRSRRPDGAFVTVSSPSLSQELLESELFGHVKGAFTGAYQDTIGRVAAATGGTLFLDEIGELPLGVQARLLRLLQEREYERVGESIARPADVRIISATNRDLAKAVAGGTFREDLYYRLNVISLQMPPLRERAADIERLALLYLNFAASHTGKAVRTFAPAAVDALRGYSWPGNLRELRNVIERAVILSDHERIEIDDLSDIVRSPSEVRLGGEFTLEQIEAEHIRRLIAGQKTLDKVAEILQIDPATLYRKRKRL